MLQTPALGLESEALAFRPFLRLRQKTSQSLRALNCIHSPHQKSETPSHTQKKQKIKIKTTSFEILSKRKGPSFLMFARRHCATWIQIWMHPGLGSWVQFLVLLKGSRAYVSTNEISDTSWECGFGVVNHRSLNLKRRNSNDKMFLLALWTGNLKKTSWLARRAVGSWSAQDRDSATEAGSAPSLLQKASRLSCPLWA